MASYQQSPFYGQSQAPPQFPLTPSSQNDEFAHMIEQPYYENFNFGFDGIGGQSSALPPHSSEGARAISPIEFGADSTSGKARSSSEEKEVLTPSQRRRKEQNRAAQRAFRERKERHVKELETRLASLEQANTRAAAENDKLRDQLEKTRLENRLLQESSQRGHSPPEMPEVGPMLFRPLDSHQLQQNPPSRFTSPIFGEHPNRGPIHRISKMPKTGERLLGAGAAWDLIICHPLYQQGMVDIGDISEKLKALARCDGQGPVFEESVILEAINASSGSGRDELLID